MAEVDRDKQGYGCRIISLLQASTPERHVPLIAKKIGVIRLRCFALRPSCFGGYLSGIVVDIRHTEGLLVIGSEKGLKVTWRMGAKGYDLGI